MSVRRIDTEIANSPAREEINPGVDSALASLITVPGRFVRARYNARTINAGATYLVYSPLWDGTAYNRREVARINFQPPHDTDPERFVLDVEVLPDPTGSDTESWRGELHCHVTENDVHVSPATVLPESREGENVAKAALDSLVYGRWAYSENAVLTFTPATMLQFSAPWKK